MNKEKIEGFYRVPDYSINSLWDPDWVGKISDDCYNLTDRDCMKYTNCGLCIRKGRKECIPGDYQGPLFKQDCDLWQYTDFYDRYIFGEKWENTYHPWSRMYPEYEAIYPSPVIRSTLK
jgi:hypothetical protein